MNELAYASVQTLLNPIKGYPLKIYLAESISILHHIGFHLGTKITNSSWRTERILRLKRGAWQITGDEDLYLPKL